VHLPRAELRQEMLAAPQLVRFTFPYQDGDTKHPTLIIKAQSLLLKYIIQGVALELTFFATSDGRCAYALYVEDDPDNGAFLWSVLANGDEVAAINDLSTHNNCAIYLFNEACTNCAWASATIKIDGSALALANNSPCDDPNPSLYSSEISSILDRVGSGSANNVIRSGVSITTDWKPLSSTFILNGVRSAALNLLVDNEGTHQEQLAHALLGDLSPKGAYLNTMLHDPSGNKEFMDVVLTHEYGTILLESKSLSIFEQRTALPPRSKLTKNIKKAVNKAFKQLTGAARTLSKDITVFNESGEPIELERNQPIHAIILVPDLALLANDSQEWFASIAAFMKKTGGFLHILDTVQLFRMSQAASMISKAAEKSTPMMAFHFYLMERAKAVSKSGSIDFDMVLLLQK